MPFFNEDSSSQASKFVGQSGLVYSLQDAFQREIPVTSVEFNPPMVSCQEKQETDYWLQLAEPDVEDRKVLRSLKSKLKSLIHCHRVGSFVSVTDSAAGFLRLHNLSMIRLLGDANFCERWFNNEPITWEPRRTIIHLTRNHSITWLDWFFQRLKWLNFENLLLITGDPLKEVRLKACRAEKATELPSGDRDTHRLKNSVALVEYVRRHHPHFFVGVGHNPFLKAQAANKHLDRKLAAGAQYIITQPVSYYEECWRAVSSFEAFFEERGVSLPVVLGVFNYFVPCNALGYKPEDFDKRAAFWKKLFGFVPNGVRTDYDHGLNGVEILARSINKLKRMGYYHFDVMNAERVGWSVVRNEQRFLHEMNRIEGNADSH